MSTLSLITVSLNKGNICATSASLNLRRQTERNLLRKNLLLLRLSLPSVGLSRRLQPLLHPLTHRLGEITTSSLLWLHSCLSILDYQTTEILERRRCAVQSYELPGAARAQVFSETRFQYADVNGDRVLYSSA